MNIFYEYDPNIIASDESCYPKVEIILKDLISNYNYRIIKNELSRLEITLEELDTAIQKAFNDPIEPYNKMTWSCIHKEIELIRKGAEAYILKNTQINFN